MFYDSIVEVIAEDLVFGSGAFSLEDHPELSLAPTAAIPMLDLPPAGRSTLSDQQ